MFLEVSGRFSGVEMFSRGLAKQPSGIHCHSSCHHSSYSSRPPSPVFGSFTVRGNHTGKWFGCYVSIAR